MPSRFRLAFSSAFLVLSLSSLGTAAAAEPIAFLNAGGQAEGMQVPALDRAVVRFAGMASGSYFWQEGLVAEQLIDGLATAMHRKELALPGDRRLLSSYRRMNGGAERAAVLVDDRSGEVLAAALAHRGCGAAPTCRGDDQHAELVVFLRPGVDRAEAQPLLTWSTQVPKDDLVSGEDEKIVRTDYVTLDAAHTAARPAKRPKGFAAQVPLYPNAQLHSTYQQMVSNAKAGRVMRLQTTDSQEQVIAFYKQLSPPLKDFVSHVNGPTGFIAGSSKGVAFVVNLTHGRRMPAVTNIEVELSE
ncbi:hypothetical protein ACSFBM_19250 [Variovorax sp. GB1R11]|uniref:hypothetical protein n=1 Tax=Variovorax sp. GB1R11 TaxID=3443741 RepID=UPI003F44FF60